MVYTKSGHCGLDPRSIHTMATKAARAVPGHPPTPSPQWIPGRAALARNDRGGIKDFGSCFACLGWRGRDRVPGRRDLDALLAFIDKDIDIAQAG